MQGVLEVSDAYQILKEQYIAGPDEANWQLVASAATTIYQATGGDTEKLKNWLEQLRKDLNLEAKQRGRLCEAQAIQAEKITEILGNRAKEASTRAVMFDNLMRKLRGDEDEAGRTAALSILALLPPETLNALFGGVRTNSAGEDRRNRGSNSGPGIDEEIALAFHVLAKMGWPLPEELGQPKDGEGERDPDGASEDGKGGDTVHIQVGGPGGGEDDQTSGLGCPYGDGPK